jgi:uncharacterized membrane protein HdeD (DUF308 family)
MDNKETLLTSMGVSVWLAGILLVILGLLGVFFPDALSLTLTAFLSGLMLAGGVLYGYYVYKLHTGSFSAWLKPLVLIVGGVLLLSFPAIGISAIALLLSFYLFTDAFSSFGMAKERHPLPGWFWMALNGVISLVLAMFILVGWPETSALFLGIFLGVSLLIDGLMMFMFGLALKSPGSE